jgi:hypothetical protein
MVCTYTFELAPIEGFSAESISKSYLGISAQTLEISKYFCLPSLFCFWFCPANFLVLSS